MRWSLFILPVVLVTRVGALLPGGWEPYSTEVNADAWTVFGYYFDEDEPDEDRAWKTDFFYPVWSGGSDPFIGFTMSWGSALIFADAQVGEGAFTGDYGAADVKWITMDVAISDTSLVEYFDLSIESSVDGVARYYYTGSYTVDTYQDNVWEAEVIPLDDTWYYWEPIFENDVEVGGDWVPVTLSDTILSNITEIGITFVHADQSGRGVDVMIDNVALNHPVVTPELSVSPVSGAAMFSFQPRAAHVYDLEQFDRVNQEWGAVSGQTDILGPDPFRFTAPAGGAGLYRILAVPYYTAVESVPGE